MSDLINRPPFADATNVPRPSRRPCAAVPLRPVAAVGSQNALETVMPVANRQTSPVSERSTSPLSPTSGSQSNLIIPNTAANMVSTMLSVPQMYERMNVLMLEMNMLMAQWEVAMHQGGVEGNSQQPPSEAFKGMLSVFGSITAQYAQHQQKQQQVSAPVSAVAVVDRKQVTPLITTVHQSAASHHYNSRSATTSPEAQPEAAEAPAVRHNSHNHMGAAGERVPRNSLNSQNLDLDRDCIVAVVEFKRQRMKRFACAHFVEPGQYVIVDGDRGQDCGFVVYCSVRNSDGSLGLTQSIENARLDVTRIKAEPGIVRGLASEKDIALLHGDIATNERMALKICRDLVEQMDLPMKVVDCEYQFDRRKISFYFESSRSIDFRTLTTELYRIFGVRIWLENQNNKVKNIVPDGAFSHNDKSSFQRNGLRPPTL